MKLKGILHVLLVLVASGVALTDTTHDRRGPDDRELHDGNNPKILKNYEGWVNPEDLAPMPQCIAQQDQTGWLSAMTKCTRHRCIHYFIVCTYFQWLTELSCLSAEFSPTAVEPYMEYCSRSVLAKAQLANWIKQITGRNWLVHAGDTSGLQNLSPRSLTQGYETVSVEQKAPACLRKATSLNEVFVHVLGSCSFTDRTLHNGNAARPWEYSTARESITALSFDTAGYYLTNAHIPPGNYFDKECFCSTFSIDPQHEPCSNQLDLTKQRLWLHAICGSSKLPQNWKKSLKIVGVDYIPPSKWTRSSDIPNMPYSVTSISFQCRTEACNTDSKGFCKLSPVIDRACVCGKLNYSLCEGPCQNFESRTKYIQWLHTLCDDVEGWHGLPDNWHDLLTLQRGDMMIPWDWNLRPETPKEGRCPSYWTKISSFAFVNMATFVAVYLGEKSSRNFNSPEPHPKNPVWVLRGLVLAAIQLAGNWANVKFIQSTQGYENIPIFYLMLLWCSLPRVGWIPIAPARITDSISKDLVAACSALYAEVFLQIPNMYYMTRTVIRGLQHFFYFGFLPDREIGYCAWLMYGGAFLWLVSVSLLSVAIIRKVSPLFATHTLVFRAVEEPLRGDERPIYGTIPAVAGPSQPPKNTREPHLSLYNVLSVGFIIIFLAQWLFWIGFIRVSGVNYCPPSLGILTCVWMASSLTTVVLKFII
ncbi:hypothetical protein FSST1_009730 [Fusarium sambucinum]